jgi:hypothetical protein
MFCVLEYMLSSFKYVLTEILQDAGCLAPRIQNLSAFETEKNQNWK